MKNLRVICILFVSLLTVSCSSDDPNETPVEGPAVQATLHGGTFSNYNFKLGVYEVAKGTNGNTLNINLSDKNGKMITLFLNSSGGFTSGTVKQINDVDSGKFKTNAVIRDGQVSYFSSKGSIKITHNRDHPTNAEQRMISGEFNIDASTIDQTQSTTIKGTFVDLVYIQ